MEKDDDITAERKKKTSDVTKDFGGGGNLGSGGGPGEVTFVSRDPKRRSFSRFVSLPKALMDQLGVEVLDETTAADARPTQDKRSSLMKPVDRLRIEGQTLFPLSFF